MKTFYIKYFIFICVYIVTTTFLLYSPIVATTTANINFSYFQVSVYCSSSNSYIDNATICIINNRNYYQTNKYGKTPVIKLQLAESWKNGDFYLINLLCYKNGFEDYLYFNLKLKPNQKRMDIVIYLDEITDEAHSPSIYFEDPTESDIEQIINEYKKSIR